MHALAKLEQKTTAKLTAASKFHHASTTEIDTSNPIAA